MEARLETRLTALQADLTATLGGQIAAHVARQSELTATLGAQIAGPATRQELHAVDNKIEKRFSDLILWSFVFWVGAVGAVALLAGVLKSQ